MKVPLLDLKAQYNSLKNEINEALLNVAESQYFILGPEVEKLEKNLCEYLGCKYAIGVSSGTDALLIALMALNIQPEDEVIVPSYSFFATAGVVSRLNAIPVLTDIDPITFNIKSEDVKKKITAKTRAIIPVHLFGQSAEMDELLKIADDKITIIEDAAQAIGVQYKDGKMVGTIGDIGCFSFFPSKNLGGFGDAGLVVTNDEQLAERLHILRVHGARPKYYHKIIGGNFRIDAIQAAVLNVKLPHLDSWSEQRRRNAETYNNLFIKKRLAEDTGKTEFNNKNKVLLPKAVYKSNSLKNYHIYNQYIVRAQYRNELRNFLLKNEIMTEVYYPVPFHLQECFADLEYKKGDFPISESIANTSLALPIYPELANEQMEFVVDKINEFVEGKE